MHGTTQSSRQPWKPLARGRSSSLGSPLTSVSGGLRTIVLFGWADNNPGTTFLALSLRAEGYSVWANVEASGTTTELIRSTANDQMRNAGVQIVSLFAIVCDLMRDWRNTPGAAEAIPWLAKYFPVYGYLAEAHLGAIDNGTIIAGEMALAPNSTVG